MHSSVFAGTYEAAFRRHSVAGAVGWMLYLGVVALAVKAPAFRPWERAGLFAAACVGSLLLAYANRPIGLRLASRFASGSQPDS